MTIKALDEPDALRRVDSINAAMWRILQTARLKKVENADYRRGELTMIVCGGPNDPTIVPSHVDIQIERV